MEIHRKASEHGWIEVITGSMFSGKSEELIRRLRRAQIARQKVQIFKPLIDDRFSQDHIVSHSDMRIGSQNVKSSDELVKLEPQRGYGPRLATTDQAAYIQGLYSKTVQKYEDSVSFVAQKLGKKGVAELERLATAFYVTVGADHE